MRKLTAEPDYDRAIAWELQQARIEMIRVSRSGDEVPSRLRGRLGPIAFWRDAVYWVAHGPVPLKVALDLYEHPLGRRQIRVEGNWDGPAPGPPWVAWYTPEGERVYPAERADGYQHACDRWPHLFHPSRPVVFHDVPAAIGAAAYIDLYHVDSIDALQLFASILRRHSIDQVSRPVWWEQHQRELMACAHKQIWTRTMNPERCKLWDEDTQPLGPPEED
jgi:hypothetical protein